MTVYKIQVAQETTPFWERDLFLGLAMLYDCLEGGSAGEIATITVGEMTEEEYNALPELEAP